LINRIFNLFKTLINNRPFQVNYFYHQKIQKKINSNISIINPDHIICQLVRTALYVKDEHSIPKTIDYMDALSKGLERRITISKFWQKPFVKMESQRMKRFENLAFEFFNNHIIISSSDRDEIAHIKNKNIEIIPNGIDSNYFKKITTNKIYDLIFIGNLSYIPNIEAAKYISKTIFPILKEKIPNIKILISGSNPSKKVLRLANKNIKISGWVDDIRETYCSGKVFFAPMNLGSGLQNKLLEAMSLGIPCITSNLCNESLGGTHMKNIIIGNSAEEYISQILNILSNSELISDIGKNGSEYVNKKFSWENSNKKLMGILKHKQSN
ncbi:glycosyltransferase, partial [Bacteroidota bacterium]|nr:glycosyltransferase [Bacteroidota bacterium]